MLEECGGLTWGSQVIAVKPLNGNWKSLSNHEAEMMGGINDCYWSHTVFPLHLNFIYNRISRGGILWTAQHMQNEYLRSYH